MGDTPDSNAEPWQSPIPFDTATARIIAGDDTVAFLVEVALTADQHQVGLMERPQLDPGSGMIFVYGEDQQPEDGFWMFRTRIPLDIAFADSTGRIVTVLQMEPCDSPNPEWCRGYSPGVRYRSALEVNRGVLEQHGVEVGDSLVVEVR